ncbi:hypothetical protein EV359DRAFT_64889 [Lentinula novae-zelandiae]|nr:hypothetical protein EV359DRAFT_64889 [Lentinula novae-zelandiae]
MMLLRSCSLLLFIGILLGNTSVIGSPIAGTSHLERRMNTYDVRIGSYRITNAHNPKTKGWVRLKSQHEEDDVQCICFGSENANCFGLLLEQRTMQVLHITALAVQKSQSSISDQEQPDPKFFLPQKKLSVKWDVLGKWKHEKFATVWDILKDILQLQKEMGNASFPVDDQESYIKLIKAYLIMEGIIVEKP